MDEYIKLDELMSVLFALYLPILVPVLLIQSLAISYHKSWARILLAGLITAALGAAATIIPVFTFIPLFAYWRVIDVAITPDFSWPFSPGAAIASVVLSAIVTMISRR